MLRLAPQNDGEFALTVGELLDGAVSELQETFGDDPEVRAVLFETIAFSYDHEDNVGRSVGNLPRMDG